jgi:hypothetical protein
MPLVLCRRRLVVVLSALLLSLLAACGGGGGVAGSPSHDSADGAVRGLVDALAANDLNGAADWVAPGERSDFTGALDQAKQLGLKITFQVKGFTVGSVSQDKSDANKAYVKYSGEANACVSAPTSGRADNCTPIQSQSGRSNADTFVCVRQDGRWYVSISSTVQGARPRAHGVLA